LNDLTIYHKKILELASANRKSFEINDFNFSKEVKNPLCGDLVEVRVNIINSSIKNLSAKVKGCALCEASTGLLSKNVIGLNFKNSFILKENLSFWLNEKLDKFTFSEIENFSPVKKFKNRYKCVLLSFDALQGACEKHIN